MIDELYPLKLTKWELKTEKLQNYNDIQTFNCPKVSKYFLSEIIKYNKTNKV